MLNHPVSIPGCPIRCGVPVVRSFAGTMGPPLFVCCNAPRRDVFIEIRF